jgi:phosphopantetheinyl transferase
MQTLIANFSHLDKVGFHKNKSIYSQKQMINCLKKTCSKTLLSPKIQSYSISKDAFGKPYGNHFENTSCGCQLPVTTSHSYPYIYSAASNDDVLLGCDVEKIRVFDDFFLSSFLCQKELLYIHSVEVSIRDEVATRAWVIKESILKAIGTGISVNPKRLDVSMILQGKDVKEYAVLFDNKTVTCTVSTLFKKDDFLFCCVLVPVVFKTINM